MGEEKTQIEAEKGETVGQTYCVRDKVNKAGGGRCVPASFRCSLRSDIDLPGNHATLCMSLPLHLLCNQHDSIAGAYA